jgi:hypothetical protein
MFTRLSRASRKTASSQRATSARAHCNLLESLEPRQLLAVDLSAALINVAPTVTRGTRQSADLVITNNGDTTATGRARTTIYMIPEDSTFSPKTAIRLATIRPRLNLAAGDSVTIPIAPQISRGTTTANFQLVAAVATNNAFHESDLTNNTAVSDPFTVNPSGSDISATITNVSPAAVTRGRETAALTLTNNGTANATGRIRVPIFSVAQGATFDPTTTRALTTVTPRVNLAPGASMTVPLSVPLSRTTTSGNFQLVASADTANTLNEANTAKNTAQSTFFTVVPATGLTTNSSGQLTTANGTVITDANGNTFNAVQGTSNGVVLKGPNGNFLTTAAGNTVPSATDATVITNSNGTVLTNAAGNPFFLTTTNVAGTPTTSVSTANTVNTINSLNNLGLASPVSIVTPTTTLPASSIALTPTALSLTPTTAASTSLLIPSSLNITPSTAAAATVGNVGLSSLVPTSTNTFPILSNTSIPIANVATGPVTSTSF